MSIRKPRSSRAGRVTMQEVARRVGVSAITVSRALRTPDKVAEELRQRIARVCQELGYVPNHAASVLASARSQTIVALIPSLSNVVFVDIIAGIKEELDRHGYHMLIGVTGYSPDEEEALLRKYMQHAPDGLILTGIDHNPGVWELLDAQRIPTVHTIETLDGGEHMSVGFSQFDSGYAAGRHLVERGYRRIGVVGAQLDPRSLRRCEGCRQALRDAGLYDPALEIMTPEKSSISLGASLLEDLRAAHPDCDAVFFCNDDLAQGAVFQCGRLGVPVPEKMAIVGFHDVAGTAWTTPPLSTIATPRYQIGVSAARLLMRHLSGQPVEERHVDLGFKLVQRETS
ncbi:LacI family DNA-binding transcriptional regulator [Achromobacter anxifer]|jgi:LacI family gluconate utilization system Gnt-I transcriptional repressor|uniref:HTH-type transcriptional regulator GntR n=1 Tax=Achromobacter anxifer TaxID=1287737 RepID=A0A6S7EIJ4_9BURK|nr:LacI family DNA-binding transcriptional regulator [Achromobacter anxifer]MDF8363101.1 LacI family DNA-binding transcriptional regulator [Achromobacter anxifer]CAB3911756.1 HTH-type transcriptional regulator GntR [Achromobacter anxifer]CAB5516895.1 HTH-type transcriptional regulator GntR [Achromobacter anxifer]